MKFKILLFLLLISMLGFKQSKSLPEGFVYVKDVIPDIHVDMRYFSKHNFVGDTIRGYNANKLILTKLSAEALKKVNEELLLQDKCLLIYDAYRPQRAVDHFIEWAKDLNDTLMKAEFYPDVKKQDLFKEEYIAARSGHSKGSTVDLTIINSKTNEPLDMGSYYDFFGVQSWVNYEFITDEQKANRQLLQEVMLKHGFKNYPREWWHFTLKEEPFPETYFDFPIE